MNLNKAFDYSGNISKIIVNEYKAIPLIPFLACFGDNQNKIKYEILWKSMIDEADVLVIFDANKMDEQMKKEIEYAKAINKTISYS